MRILHYLPINIQCFLNDFRPINFAHPARSTTSIIKSIVIASTTIGTTNTPDRLNAKSHMHSTFLHLNPKKMAASNEKTTMPSTFFSHVGPAFAKTEANIKKPIIKINHKRTMPRIRLHQRNTVFASLEKNKISARNFLYLHLRLSGNLPWCHQVH